MQFLCKKILYICRENGYGLKIMSKISMLRAIVNNGWTIANRHVITSRIGKANYDEIITLAQKQGLTGDIFQYQLARDVLIANNIDTAKTMLNRTNIGNFSDLTIFELLKELNPEKIKMFIKSASIKLSDAQKKVLISFKTDSDKINRAITAQKFKGIEPSSEIAEQINVLSDYLEKFKLDKNIVTYRLERNYRNNSFLYNTKLPNGISLGKLLEDAKSPEEISNAVKYVKNLKNNVTCYNERFMSTYFVKNKDIVQDPAKILWVFDVEKGSKGCCLMEGFHFSGLGNMGQEAEFLLNKGNTIELTDISYSDTLQKFVLHGKVHN